VSVLTGLVIPGSRISASYTGYILDLESTVYVAFAH
jgi:hypothetical protein